MTLNTDQARDARLRSTYGIDEAQYEALYLAQNGACAICLRPPQPGSVLVVDHNHESGGVRALLCSACNTGIGLLGDDPVRLRAAELYLLLHGHYARPDAVPGTGPASLQQAHPDLAQAAAETTPGTLPQQQTSATPPKVGHFIAHTIKGQQ